MSAKADFLVGCGFMPPFNLDKTAAERATLGAILMAITHEIISYGGWENNLAISNDACELFVTLDVGPRILSFSLNGGKNVFKVFEEQLGTTEEDLWQSRGGHRLWIAPESFPGTYYPDNYTVDHQIFPNGAVTVQAPDEMPQGFSKAMDISLDETRAKVRVVHRLTNVVDEEQEVAAWMLSVMAPGGVAIVPQPPLRNHPGMGPGDFLPNRTLTLWPFTVLSDARFYFGPKFLTVSHDEEASATKIGLNSPVSWAAYANDGTLFVKRFHFQEGAHYPDKNSAIEIFANEEILEVETLSPLRKLKPGGVLEAVEEWELFGDVPPFDPTDDVAINAMLRELGVI